jgi:hypothetical protein
MAQFGIPTQDENLQPGWNVQGTGPAQSTTGVPGAGYAESGVVPATTAVGQTGSGYPNPPGALDIGAENSGTYTTPILENGSYAVTPTTLLTQTAAAPLPVTANGVQQPFGLGAQAVITGSAITSVKTAPFSSSGVPATGSGSWTTVFTGTASANPITVTVPPAGYVLVVGGNASAVTYTPTN